MTAPIEQRCASCRFARINNEEDETYLCRRRAPQRFDLDFLTHVLRSIALSQLVISERSQHLDGAVHPDGRALDYIALWPEVSADDWCGEYATKRTKKLKQREDDR
jgi:hypothetical protein